jgi:hypothetical protein
MRIVGWIIGWVVGIVTVAGSIPILFPLYTCEGFFEAGCGDEEGMMLAGVALSALASGIVAGILAKFILDWLLSLRSDDA